MDNEAWIRARIERTTAGDIESFGEIVDLFQVSVRGFIAMLGVPQDVVEDLAQETFLLAYREIGRFEPGKPFGPWIRGIARNLVRRYRDAAGSEARRRQATVAELLGRMSDREEPFEPYPVQHLRTCLESLPETSAALVRARYVEGRTPQQIADLRRLRPEAIRMALMRIRLKLKECVERRLGLESS